MRVVNDKEESPESTEVGFSLLLTQVLVTGLGIATGIFAPLTMIIGHMKLTEPWQKIAAMAGAILALLVLEAPLPLVVMAFAFGLFVADGVSREVAFWRLLPNAVLVASLLALGTLFVSATYTRADLATYWTSLVDNLVTTLKSGIKIENPEEWNAIRGLILYEAHFLFMSFAVLSFWLSIGIAAHFKWIPEKHAYSGKALRKLSLPTWASWAYIALFVAYVVGPVRLEHLWGGLFRLGGSLMFIQGCICLSRLFEIKGVQSGFVRTGTYIFAVVLGFYAVIGMGVVSPWFFRRKGGDWNRFQLRKMEEVV